MTVGLVLVSHSADLAAGVAELARQMAPDVVIAEAGGADDGGLGTSFDRIVAALAAADDGAGAVLLYDLGSALLTAETALEFADPEAAARIRILSAPLVEGAVAASVAAQSGADLDEVAAAVARDTGQGKDPGDAGDLGDGDARAESSAQPPASATSRTVRVINPLGLHARPAAALVRALSGLTATVTVGRPAGAAVDVRQVLRVVGLALRGGDDVVLAGSGPDAAVAVQRVDDLITGGFGEAAPAGRIPLDSMGAAPARLGNTPAARSGAVTPTLVDGLLTAVPGAPGLAIGPLVPLDRAPIDLPADRTPRTGTAGDEVARLHTALLGAERKLAAGNQFDAAHAALLADPELAGQAQECIAGGDDAARAWWRTIQSRADALSAEPDELVAARAVDLREAGSAVLAELGIVLDRIPARLDGGIVVTDDLGPGEVPVLLERGAAGVVLAGSSVTAHAVIVSRGLGLPMVLRAGTDLLRRLPGTTLVLDGDAGTVRVDPDATVLAQQRDRLVQEAARRDRLLTEATAPAVLPDGRRIVVAANVGSLADAHAAVANGADGVGLLRTELLLLDRATYPDEDTQTADLRAILTVLAQRPVVVRVLDAGGDKPVTALDLDERRNGFLGVRGLRYLLAHPDLLRTQLRAIMRASVGHHVSVMAPMVSIAGEVTAFRAAVTEAARSLVESGHEYTEPEEVGAMIEVPSAALAADEICQVADFVSVGSNDLTSYLMAADRTLPDLAELLDPGSTAVQRTLDQLFALATAAGVRVAVCGEIAAMPGQVPGLVRRGVSELSMAPARIPEIKRQLRTLHSEGV